MIACPLESLKCWDWKRFRGTHEERSLQAKVEIILRLGTRSNSPVLELQRIQSYRLKEQVYQLCFKDPSETNDTLITHYIYFKVALGK